MTLIRHCLLFFFLRSFVFVLLCVKQTTPILSWVKNLNALLNHWWLKSSGEDNKQLPKCQYMTTEYLNIQVCLFFKTFKRARLLCIVFWLYTTLYLYTRQKRTMKHRWFKMLYSLPLHKFTNHVIIIQGTATICTDLF